MHQSAFLVSSLPLSTLACGTLWYQLPRDHIIFGFHVWDQVWTVSVWPLQCSIWPPGSTSVVANGMTWYTFWLNNIPWCLCSTFHYQFIGGWTLCIQYCWELCYHKPGRCLFDRFCFYWVYTQSNDGWDR